MKICPYCAFYKRPIDKQLEQRFVENICKEISFYSQSFDRILVDTIYFGGGTPNALSRQSLQKIMDSIHASFDISSRVEFTMEVNPGVHSESKLAFIQSLGVNRLSIGVQSFNPLVLDEYGRNHTVSDTHVFIEQVKKMRFKNISIDIIFGHPVQTNQQLMASLEVFLSYDFQHLAIYALAIEPNTPFSDQGLCINDDYQAEQYQMIQSYMLNHEFDHYEVSNFCRPGYESKHNAKYLLSEPTIGLGPSAHSFFNGHRYANSSDVLSYIHLFPGIMMMGEVNTWEDYIGARLRLRRPLFYSVVKERFDVDIPVQFSKGLSEMAALELFDVSDDSMMVTHKGFLLLDEALTYFI